MKKDLLKHIETARQLQLFPCDKRAAAFNLDKFGNLLEEIGVDVETLDTHLESVKELHRAIAKSGGLQDLFLIPIEKFDQCDWQKCCGDVMNLEERKEHVRMRYRFWNSRFFEQL